VQIDPIKPKLKPPGTKRLTLEYDGLPSNIGFKFKLRRYDAASPGAAAADARERRHAAAAALSRLWHLYSRDVEVGPATSRSPRNQHVVNMKSNDTHRACVHSLAMTNCVKVLKAKQSMANHRLGTNYVMMRCQCP